MSAGFHEANAWQEALTRRGAGRGAHGLFEFESGPRLFLKAFRRGGAMTRFDDRYFGRGRFERTLHASLAAAVAGVPSPRPRALWFEQRGVADWRAFAAYDWVEGRSFGELLQTDGAAAKRTLPAIAAAIVRLHDAGIRHPDLNIDNLLVENETVWVIDLDGARVRPEALPTSARRANLKRLGRSYRKHFGDPGPLEGGFAAVLSACEEQSSRDRD